MTFFGAPWPILLLVVIAVAVPIISRLLSNYAHPKRLRIEKLANELLADSKLTKDQRSFVQLSLNMNGRVWPMFLVALFLPVVFAAFLLVPSVRRESKHGKEINALREDKRFKEIQSNEVGCLFAANPIAGIIVAFEIVPILVTGIAFLIGARGIDTVSFRVAEVIERVISPSRFKHGKPSAA